MTGGHASISSDILARYAADAANEVAGVRPLGGRRSVRIADVGGVVRVELHVSVDWGVAIAEAGRSVQERVGEYLGRMADLDPASVDVVIDEVRTT